MTLLSAMDRRNERFERRTRSLLLLLSEVKAIAARKTIETRKAA